MLGGIVGRGTGVELHPHSTLVLIVLENRRRKRGGVLIHPPSVLLIPKNIRI